VGPVSAPLLSVIVTSNGYEGDELNEAGDDPFGPGWWVGSDGNWHTPDERFASDVPKRDHPVRRVAIVVLAIALIGATSAGVWGGVVSQSPSSGPSVSSLDVQVQRAVTGSGSAAHAAPGVVRAVCHPPASWSAGQTFKCDVYGSSQTKLGQYLGTVQPTSSSGEWRWEGTWKPTHQYSIT
jgi:hypothetical protein